MSKWSDIKRIEMYENGRTVCEICWKVNAVDAHHAILHAKKGKRNNQKWRNAVLNMQMLCKGCHVRYQSDREARIDFIHKQIEKHGIEALWAWLGTCDNENWKKPGTDYDEVVRLVSSISESI